MKYKYTLVIHLVNSKRTWQVENLTKKQAEQRKEYFENAGWKCEILKECDLE